MGVFETMTLASVEEEDDILVDFKEKKAGMISNRKKNKTQPRSGKDSIMCPTLSLLFIYIWIACTFDLVHSEKVSATLRGELVPTKYVKPPLEAYGCFYGLNFQNCVCFNPKIPITQGCYGPKCFFLSEKPNVTEKNFSCRLKNDRTIDCSQNDSQNIYLFTNCTNCSSSSSTAALATMANSIIFGSDNFLNSSLAVDLYDYEFRFDSIELDRQHKIIKCPLSRSTGTRKLFLYGYILYIKAHVHKVSTGFMDYEWVTQVLGCQVMQTLELPVPLPIGEEFKQIIHIQTV